MQHTPLHVLESRPTMPAHTLPIVLAIEDEAFRLRLEAVLRFLGKTPELSGTWEEAYELTPEQHRNALIVLDVGDDAARLVQVVNDLYRSPYHGGGELFVLCVTSKETLERNPSLGGWLIDGHAAVFAVWARSERAEGDLINVVYSFERDYKSEPITPLPSYDELLTQVLAQPNDADALINMANRFMVWQDDHQMNREMRIALMRHAVRLCPDDARAHMLYGHALSMHGEEEQAEQELREALRLAPEMAEAHYEMGSFLRWERPSEALPELNIAITLAPDSDTARFAKNMITSLQMENTQT